jgi:hypothetical protein
MNENDILGFDPRQLSVLTENEKPKGNPNIYHTRPEDSKSKDGVYRATIRVVYNPFNFTQSIIEQQGYYFEDEDGGFYVVSALTNNDTNCPIFKAWKKCRYSDEGSDLWKQQAKKEDGGLQLFDKRFARYVTVQILEDKNQEELEGKYMIWKMPSDIYNLVMAKQNPSKESNKCPVPVMDFLFGRSIDLEVKPGPGAKGSKEYKRQTSYMGELSEDVVSCTNPDKSPLLNSEEKKVLDHYVEQMKNIWKEKDPEERNKLQLEVNADPNTAELKKIYSKVIENLKTFCPNVYDEMSFKPWDENTTKRVDKWIKIVLSGQTPKTAEANQSGPSEEVMNDVTNAPNPFDPANFGGDTPVSPSTGGDDDDLPF